ncbi:hypothetical protein QWZ08_09415 [Ferruginibacter paludis]|uniref:glucosamine inositolphosphorylceramide transferase family protein n=1 Tax=Ferruginibacter paludis TaxID=1310417 RepID=UPI0025B3F23E|nr:hypothetical protein [Ferruginibacter paludis]MDN3655841.1 hypothetical protein [Ferruginibacter paludis]
MQWGIGFCRANIEDVIRNKRLDGNFTWIAHDERLHFIADPFIFRNQDNNINLLFEDFSVERDGFIGLKVLDDQYNLIAEKKVLESSSHLSYPFVFRENGITYVIPESHQQGKVFVYEYDFLKDELVNGKILVDLPLLDTTIVKIKDTYWLFANYGDGIDDNNKLYIYYSDALRGEYKPHSLNPVRNNLDGTRPAGNFIVVDGILYRPSQNCGKYYGKSITISEIIHLTPDEFEERHHCEISADHKSEYSAGLHTINVLGDIIVIDGVKLLFMPFTKTRLFLKKVFKKVIKI